MMRISRKCAKWMLAFAVVGAAAVTGIKSVHSSQDMKKVTAMTEKMKTVCVGRYLIDLPAEAQVTLKMARLSGFEISGYRETQKDFLASISDRETELAANSNTLGRSNIELSREVRGRDVFGKLLIHSRLRHDGMKGGKRVSFETVTIEGYVNNKGHTFSFISEGADPSRVPVATAMMMQVHSKDESQIPLAPGFCIDSAFIADPFEKERDETIAMFAGLPAHPDFRIMLWSNAASVQGAGLIDRNAAAMDALMRARTRMLRENTRKINGLHGEEIGLKTTELNFATGYSFAWETRGTDNDVSAPYISFEMDAGLNPRAGGKPVQSSLSEEAMLKLWDKISSSIRLRPTGPLHAVQPERPATPLGAYAEAGERCPQSGWWLCTDAGHKVGVLGGQRQYLRQGQKMPQALLLPPQTLWQKVRGLQPSYESRTRTAWKLVDKRQRERVAPPVPLAQATLAAQADAGNAIDSAYSLAQPGASIKCCVQTGVQCPASGWWRCEEPGALDGTRWFAAGSLLPPATFALPPAGFGRGLGRLEAIQRRSLWQLVRHAPMPGPDASQPDGTSPDTGDAPAQA